jgi:hypothetical protein
MQKHVVSNATRAASTKSSGQHATPKHGLLQARNHMHITASPHPADYASTRAVCTHLKPVSRLPVWIALRVLPCTVCAVTQDPRKPQT